MLLTKYEIDVLTAVKTLIVAFWVVADIQRYISNPP
jgi:hypothetical protein